MDKPDNSDGSIDIEDDTTYMAALRKWLTWGHVKKKSFQKLTRQKLLDFNIVQKEINMPHKTQKSKKKLVLTPSPYFCMQNEKHDLIFSTGPYNMQDTAK